MNLSVQSVTKDHILKKYLVTSVYTQDYLIKNSIYLSSYSSD